MTKVQVKTQRISRVSQGDIFRDIECIEYVVEKRGIVEVSKLVFPLVVVLTQDCDLEQDAHYRRKGETPPVNHDKKLFSVLVAPVYNAAHVFLGQHLSDLGMTMAPINEKRTPGDMLKNNERPRYHYLNFPDNIPIVASIVDFKHYFSVSVSYLEKARPKKFVCRLSALFREDLSLRFAGYLARIGLPDIVGPSKSLASASSPGPTPSLT